MFVAGAAGARGEVFPRKRPMFNWLTAAISTHPACTYAAARARQSANFGVRELNRVASCIHIVGINRYVALAGGKQGNTACLPSSFEHSVSLTTS